MHEHWIWLTTRKGIGTRGRAALLRLFGSAERIYEATEADFQKTEGFQRRWRESLLDKSLDISRRILKRCADLQIQLLTYCDKAYPERLKSISDAPALLYYQGKLPEFDKEAAIAVVGSRTCSPYGMLYAKQFGRLIACSGGVVVSGGARGVDTMALHGALESTVPVVCVLGCGLDITYPQENSRLFDQIRRHGCLISEYPPGTPPDASNFPVRNRIISGLSLATLVVEAPERSGSLITARLALEQGRDVYAVPGNLGVKSCAGSNRLIREGAMMAESGWQILQEYAYLFPGKLEDGRSKKAMQRIYQIRYGMSLPVYSPIALQDYADKKDVDKPMPKLYSDSKGYISKLNEDEQKILELLSEQPRHFDNLMTMSGLSAQRTAAALTILQIRQLALKLAGNYYQRKFD